MEQPILGPVFALAAWTMLMWLWMYVTRIPAVQRSGMKLDPNAPRGEQMASLPPRVRWKADNYNHLLEQPILFYAVAIGLAQLGQGHGLNLTLAWAYVVLRVIHSLWQALSNVIEIRFVLFIVSSLPLIGLIVNGCRATLLS